MTNIAIIGSGIAGLSCSYFLHQHGYHVHLFEANDYVGGHTHTKTVSLNKTSYAVDTGFIVCNERSYPNFIQILRQLKVATQPTDMSFSVYDPMTKFQYAGGSLRSIFAQRKHLISPRFYRFVADIARFQRYTKSFLRNGNQTMSVADFLEASQFNSFFARHYLYPLIASLWSAPSSAIANMPFIFVAHFFYNHALLQMVPDLPWQVIAGGSAQYVQALITKVQPTLVVKTAIKKISRHPQGWELYSDRGLLGRFDEIIVATHSDQALAMLAHPSALEREILSAFRYQNNSVILHQDARMMPDCKAAWASWNARLGENIPDAVLTYDMNRLQNIPNSSPFYVSLNADHMINPEAILERFNYSHPQYSLPSLAAQQRQQELNSHAGIYFCGAYWGYGFHEDGVNSALAVCRQLLKKLLGTDNVFVK